MSRPRKLAAALLAAGLLTAPLTLPAQQAEAARPHPHGDKLTTPAKRPHPKRKPWPIHVTVQTVPALPGVRLVFDGTTLLTDAHGRAVYTHEHDLAPHQLVLQTTAVDTPIQRYRFARWAGQRNPDDTYRTTVTGLPMRADYTVTAAFAVQFPLTAAFTDQHGAPIAPSRISDVQLRSESGQLITIPADGTLWLTGLSPVYHHSELSLQQAAYTLQRLTVDDASVADAGRQSVTPSATHGRAVFQGRFYDLTVTAHDALFGGTTGQQVTVDGPGGRVYHLTLGDTLRGLPRGHYTISVHAPGAMVLPQEIQLSQDHTTDISVVTRADLATVGGCAATAAVLLLSGRLLPRLRSRRAAARPSPTPEADPS